MDTNRNVAKNPVSDEEKKLLRNFVARAVTAEERDSFLVKNYPYLNEKARGVFMDMSATDQYRVIFDGPMKEAKDPVEILYGRVKRFLDMELQLRALSKRSGEEPEKSKKEPSRKMQELSERIAHSLANPKYQEVPAHERRCSGVNQILEEEPKPKIIEGTVKGVGGVIEAMQKKYAMKKGERLRVVNETKDLWKLEGEKTVPKSQVNSGWKWVVKGAEDEKNKEAKKKPAKDEATKKVAEPEKSPGRGHHRREPDVKDGKKDKKAKEKSKEGKAKEAKDDKKEKAKEKGKEKAKDKEKEKEKGKDKEKAKKEAKKEAKKGKSKRKRSEDSESESDKKSEKKASAKRKSKRRKSSSSKSEASSNRKKSKRRKSSSSESQDS